ncbi:hypothetical protein XENORESO_015367, partial [Xenotaenia resolanae]
AQLTKAQQETGVLKLQLQKVELELETLKKQLVPAADSSSLVNKEEVNILRQKIEDLEKDRQRLEEQNNILEMRLERHNLQDNRPIELKTCFTRVTWTRKAAAHIVADKDSEQ